MLRLQAVIFSNNNRDTRDWNQAKNHYGYSRGFIIQDYVPSYALREGAWPD